jgi:hypothetical protein
MIGSLATREAEKPSGSWKALRSSSGLRGSEERTSEVSSAMAGKQARKKRIGRRGMATETDRGVPFCLRGQGVAGEFSVSGSDSRA